MKQEQVRSNLEGGSCEDEMKTTRSFQLDHPPNWTGPARQMAELVACSVKLGHPPNWTGPAQHRQMAKLVACSFQLAEWPFWSRVRSSSAIRRAGLVRLGGWPSWPRVRSSSAIRPAGLVQLGHPPSLTGSARRMAELVGCLI
ncbi:hypothetical protein F2Q68_00039797 [Brassica cretica]|uniref:Uncharacterized protein n=1 Tax=Brassica cretica TaxID=69181 RepID=A0A8S9MIC8_BRACR|nr:hypothetical protein F2Q68_00039797 [Brassica cretica]